MFTWNVDPEILQLPFTIGEGTPHGIRWYGLLFAAAFLLGFKIMTKIYKNEGKNVADLDSLLMHVILGTIIGARLGHCLFYEPAEYLREPWRILFIWEGGLASHGGTLGNIFSVFLYCRKHRDQAYIWLADRIAVPMGLAGACIRMGNLFNSEIVGMPTTMPWGVHFARVDADVIYRHPSMVYEAICYFTIFLICNTLYNRWGKDTKPGSLIGIFAILTFGSRFFLEFTKENQVDFESGMLLNMGQLLSVPFVLVGIALVMYSRNAPSAATSKK